MVRGSMITEITGFDIHIELGFNLSNGVIATLESSSILIYLIQVKGIYTQKNCVD
jgi:hypothetical protein